MESKLKLKSGWKALAILKNVVGTIGKVLLYVGILIPFAYFGALAGCAAGFILSPGNLYVSVATIAAFTTYGIAKGREKSRYWTPTISDKISSTVLPSAYRADKAGTLHHEVEKIRARLR